MAESGWRAWPPRLPEQPIFYPVLTLDYARKIARDWNAKDAASGYVGFVTRFEVTDECARWYAVERAGGRRHEELWVPAAELEAFNTSIVGAIVVLESFPGPGFRGALDPVTHLPLDLRQSRRAP